MEDPATETAKAVQEVAKAGGEAIKATRDLGAFTTRARSDDSDDLPSYGLKSSFSTLPSR